MTLSEEKSGAWFTTLPLELKSTIKILRKPIPYLNIFILTFFISVWFIMGWIILAYPVWPVELMCSIIIAFIIHALVIGMHECIHGTMFYNRPTLNYWVGFLLGACGLMSATAYKITHLLHHKYTRSPKDPDEFTNLTSNSKVHSIGFYCWIIIGMPLYLIHILITSLQNGSMKQRCQVVFEEGIIFTLIGLSLYLPYANNVLHCWLIPAGITALMANFRAWSEHTMTRQEHPLLQSRTVVSNSVLSFLLLNQNYNLEHHLFPAMPWYRLKKIHHLLENEYKKANVFVCKSYLRFIWRAMCKGIHCELPALIDRTLYWAKYKD